jgi:hypothetical protein
LHVFCRNTLRYKGREQRPLFGRHLLSRGHHFYVAVGSQKRYRPSRADLVLVAGFGCRNRQRASGDVAAGYTGSSFRSFGSTKAADPIVY